MVNVNVDADVLRLGSLFTVHMHSRICRALFPIYVEETIDVEPNSLCSGSLCKGNYRC